MELCRIGEDAVLLVELQRVRFPGIPQGHAGLDDLVGEVVALFPQLERVEAEILRLGRIAAGDDVPPRAAVADVVQARECPGYMIGMMEGGAERGGQAEMLGDP